MQRELNKKGTALEVEIQEQSLKSWEKIKDVTKDSSKIIASHLSIHDICQVNQA